MQRDTIAHVGEGHVLCVLPTGYGKMLIIQALPYLDETSDVNTVIVVNGLKKYYQRAAA